MKITARMDMLFIKASLAVYDSSTFTERRTETGCGLLLHNANVFSGKCHTNFLKEQENE